MQVYKEQITEFPCLDELAILSCWKERKVTKPGIFRKSFKPISVLMLHKMLH